MFLWYVINTYSGHENKVKTNLEHRIVSMNQQPAFRRVVVPTEQVIETKDGQKVQTEKRVLPGYVLVNMNMSDEAWTVVKGTPGVTGFVGHVHVDEHVAGQDPLLGLHLLAVLRLDDLLGRNDHAPERRLLVQGDDAVLKVGLHLVLVPGVGVDHVPEKHQWPLREERGRRRGG